MTTGILVTLFVTNQSIGPASEPMDMLVDYSIRSRNMLKRKSELQLNQEMIEFDEAFNDDL